MRIWVVKTFTCMYRYACFFSPQTANSSFHVEDAEKDSPKKLRGSPQRKSPLSAPERKSSPCLNDHSPPNHFLHLR